VAGLLAAESGTGLEHLFENIFVTDAGTQHLNAAGEQSFFQAHVAHGCGDHGVMREDAAGFHVASRNEENGVAVDDVAVGVAEKGSVGVTVEGDAEIEVAGTALQFGGDMLRM